MSAEIETIVKFSGKKFNNVDILKFRSDNIVYVVNHTNYYPDLQNSRDILF